MKIQHLQPKWEFLSPEDPFNSFGLEDGFVYVFRRSRIEAFSADTGGAPRHLLLDHPPVGTPASFTAQDIIFACQSRGIVRVDKSLTLPPQFLWKGGDGLCNGTLTEGWLYCTCWDDTHQDLAKLSLTNAGPGWGVTTLGGIGSPATVADGRVYVGFTNGGVAAYGDNDGDRLWLFREPPRVSATGTCVVEDGVVFVATEVKTPTQLDGWIYALNAGNGNLLWKTQLDRQSMTFLTLWGDHLYCASPTTLYALHRDNGAIHLTLHGLPGVWYRTHVVPWRERLYVAADNCVIEVDPASLTAVQHYAFPGGVVQGFRIEQSTLYVSTGDSEVDGQRLGAYAF